MIIKLKRQMIISSILLILTIFSFVFVTYTWFTTKLEQNIDYETDMGLVDIGLRVYFDDGGSGIDATSVEIAPGVTKPGVYYVNIDSETSPDFIENLRVDVLVYSNIPTYFRIKYTKQLTLSYTDYLGNVTELSVYINDEIDEEFMLYYDTNWYVDTNTEAFYFDSLTNDIRNSSGTIVYTFVSTGIYTDGTSSYNLMGSGDLEDSSGNIIILSEKLFETQNEAIGYEMRHYDYIYYQNQVDTLTTIPFIIEFPSGENFGTYPDGYSLQIGFTIEAVQALGGPEYVWDLPVPPWGGSW
ncbi:MAG: hypothetical protein RBR66_04135 [Candidatus Izemoplasmatales bacterium]|nr:hypothetical protein [Candidatus Izemoplasmatales bacterium]